MIQKLKKQSTAGAPPAHSTPESGNSDASALSEIGDDFKSLHQTSPSTKVSPAAYVELCLVVADLLEGKREGRIRAEKIYSRLSELTSIMINSGSAGVPLTEIPDQPSALVSEQGRYKPTKYILGPDSRQAWRTARWIGASFSRIASATSDLCKNEDLDPLAKLIRKSKPKREITPRKHNLREDLALLGITHAPSTSSSCVIPPAGDTPCLPGSSSGGASRLHVDTGSTGPGKPKRQSRWDSQSDNRLSETLKAFLRRNIPADPLRDLKPEESAGENNVQEWSWSPDDLEEQVCERRVRRKVFELVPAAREDDILHRYVVFALRTNFYDEKTGHRVLPAGALKWIGGGEFETGIALLDYLKQHFDLQYRDHIPGKRCRLLVQDGLPQELHQFDKEESFVPLSQQKDPAYLLSGRSYTAKRGSEKREELREQLQEERHGAPSIGARKTFDLLNFGPGKDHRSSRLTSKMLDHLDQAYERVRSMDIKAGQRDYYLSQLSAIGRQHQPFYTFSSKGHTDRVFGYNDGLLNLPSEVRAILCQDFVEVDLRSAHLLIAAWLWEAGDALSQLRKESYSIWEDLMRHLKPLFHDQGQSVPSPGEQLFSRVKATLKKAVYSTVYGMPAPSIQATVTRDLKSILGRKVGERLRNHSIIGELLSKRQQKLREMEVGSVIEGPTGIRVEIEEPVGGDGVDPRSAMATLAQSYEQAAMRVILELERDLENQGGRNHFKIAVWLHDGAYVKMRSLRARTKDLDERLRKRCEDLADFAGKSMHLPAFFEVEEIEPPSVDQ